MIIFNIELRNDTDDGVENVIMHVSSTKEKSIQWCKDNIAMLLRETTEHVWFSVFPEMVDEPDVWTTIEEKPFGMDRNGTFCFDNFQPDFDDDRLFTPQLVFDFL
jgi:hypothetical protein